jgi:ribosome biogenesis GTPase
MIEGIVIKAYSGYYYVQEGNKQWVCRLRGKFRIDKINVLVGDYVKVKPADDDTGVVYEVLARRNELVRPPIANVDQAIITFAVQNPDPNLDLLDKFLLMAEGAGIKPVICLNKIDILAGAAPEWLAVYRQAGYQVLTTSTKQNLGLEDIRKVLADKVSVFAGPSGVGKSSLLNAIQPGFDLQTGEISHKLKRGKHTTRHVELLPINTGGLVADTPGFSSLYLPEIPAENLVDYFPEIAECTANCRFNSCTHTKEPDCAVKEAVAQGKISTRRYNSYLHYYDELKKRERRY